MVVALVYPLLAGKPARGAYGVAAVLAVGVAVAAGNMFVAHPSVAPTGAGPGITPVAAADAQKDWAHYGNTEGGSRFAALDQINRDTVNKLKVAWTCHTGDVALSRRQRRRRPTDALADRQQSLHLHPPQQPDRPRRRHRQRAVEDDVNAKSAVWQRCRGMAYFDATAPIAQPTQPNSSPIIAASVAAGAQCQRRLLTNTIDARLIAVDADTGKFFRRLGNHGQVDLKAGLGDVPDSYYQLSSAPLIAGTTVVVGGRVADNVQTDMPGGVIRGFDVITGQIALGLRPGNPQDKRARPRAAPYVRQHATTAGRRCH